MKRQLQISFVWTASADRSAMPTGWCPKAGCHIIPDQLIDQTTRNPRKNLRDRTRQRSRRFQQMRWNSAKRPSGSDPLPSSRWRTSLMGRIDHTSIPTRSTEGYQCFIGCSLISRTHSANTHGEQHRYEGYAVLEIVVSLDGELPCIARDVSVRSLPTL